MNNAIRRTVLGVSLVTTAFLAGCLASSKPFISKDGKTVISGAVQSVGAGRELVIREAYQCEKAMTPQQIEKYLKADHSAAWTPPPCKGESQVEAAHGTTLERDLVTGVTPVVVGGIIQRKTALDVEKERKEACKGEAGCNNTNVFTYVEAPSVTNRVNVHQSQTSSATAGASVTVPCGTACAGKNGN